ncbi:neuralized-like protein 4 [Anneissia japonica]|uniref:neuralized-like protein 4 n=1 Tax=Anneissia japonica TaxID=1529436 RepID=UPI0014258D3F|nr:neuralized-like protein 4 [Anneissia japonica]
MCMYNEFSKEIYYEGSGFGKGSGFWFLRENDLWKDFTMIGGGYKLNLRSIRVNDRVGLVRHPDGTIGFLYNGQYQGIAFRNVPGGLYGLVATTGKCVQVSITENAGRTFEQETVAGTPNAPFGKSINQLFDLLTDQSVGQSVFILKRCISI